VAHVASKKMFTNISRKLFGLQKGPYFFCFYCYFYIILLSMDI